ncbi:MAG: AsmA-like C-terminal region-containing protein [Myxococcota bacterium]
MAATLQVNDGAFRYPSLPTSVDGIQVDLAVRHPEGGVDATEIDLPRFAANVGGAPITGSLRLRNPVTDPDVAATVVGALDLALLRQALPPSDATYAGKAAVDLDVRGRVSQFTAQAVDQVTARGTLRLEDFRYTTPEQPVPVEIDRLHVTLDPRRADLAELSMRLGASDLAARGTVDNLVAYVLTDAPLVGRMDVTSRFLDLDAFTGGGSEAVASSDGATRGASAGAAPVDAGSRVVVVPTDLDFGLTARAGRVRYGGHDASDVTGTFALKDGALRIETLRMGLLGGRVELSGAYAAPTDAHADVDMRIEMVDFDAGATVAAFDALGEIVPVARGARGRFDSGFRMQARLGPDLAPDLPTVFSDGRLRTKALSLAPAFLGDVAEKLGNTRFRTLDLDDADLRFEMKNGRVAIAPTSLKVGGVAATLGGTTGALDRTLDLDLAMEVPVASVKAADLLGAIGAAKGGAADVKVKVGGTYDKPTVRLDVGGVADAIEEKVAAVVEDVTDRLLAEARAKGDALVAEAERLAAKGIAEAKKQGDALRAEAKKRADTLAAEAKGNPLAEAAAKETKKKLLAEADKKIAKLEAEAASKARAGVDAAKKEQARLLREAEAKAKTR